MDSGEPYFIPSRVKVLPKPKKPAKWPSAQLGYPIRDFYLTNAICRASPTMRRCSEELVHGHEYLEAAE